MTFLDIPGGETEETTYVSPALTELMAFLDECLVKLDEGREHEIFRDPFFESGLTDEKVDAFIKAIDDDCLKEITDFPSYHERRQGCNAPPEFARLSPGARRAMAEGAMSIIERWERVEAEQRAQKAQSA